MGGRRTSDQSDPAAEAGEALYGMPLAAFTAERKRLAAELGREGAAEAARGVAAMGKPSVSAWVVNQLYREARDEVEALLAAGRRMRAGEVEAGRDQRAALARLNQLSADLLRRDGHAASPAMLRRVTTTLQALSAIGSFDPDLPGQLVQDRDPPGFDLLAGVTLPPREAEKPARKADKAARREREPTPAREEPSPAEKRRQERAAAQRKLLEHSASQAAKRADARAHEVAGLREEVERAEATAERLREALRRAEAELAEARAAADAAIRAMDEAGVK
jgi:hypothetical protein